jgi:tetratricopeptide (TPR) repeat protein
MHVTRNAAVHALRWLVCAALLCAGQPGGGAMAQGAPAQPPVAPGMDAGARARELDDLFARLKSAKAEEEGDAIVSRIWKLWQQSGNEKVDAALERAILLMGQGLGALAMPILDEIVAEKPDWAEGWNKRATVLYLMGEHDRSLADIDRVLALEPRHFGAIAGIGLIRIEKGQTREALAALRRALAINPFLRERHGLIPQLEKELGEKPI